MIEYTFLCGDLILSARNGASGWSWMIDGLDAKNAAIARDEDSAKNACVNVARSRFRSRGVPVPECLSHPSWTMREIGKPAQALTSSARS